MKQTWKERLLTDWHLMRIVRMAIGIWMLVIAIQTRDWMVSVVSLFFLYQGVTNTGCCGSQGCYTPSRRNTYRTGHTDEIEFEEIK
jgi:hypothetical protein